MGFGYSELILVFSVIVLLFGGRKIPEVARGLGHGLREFRKARDDLRTAIEEDKEDHISSQKSDTGKVVEKQTTP